MIANLPNQISIARLFCVPAIVWLLLDGELEISFWVFLGAGISDALDGFIAKRFNATSRLGAMLDPIADKALLVAVFATLWVLGALPNWLVILVISRDILILSAVLLTFVYGNMIKVKPIWMSKINTTLQIILLLVVLGQPLVAEVPGMVIDILMGLTVITTVLSLLQYLGMWINHFKSSEI